MPPQLFEELMSSVVSKPDRNNVERVEGRSGSAERAIGEGDGLDGVIFAFKNNISRSQATSRFVIVNHNFF